MRDMTDCQAHELLRDLRILAGAEVILTALEGGPEVPDLLLLVQRRALEVSDLALNIAVRLRQQQSTASVFGDPSGGHG